jgi:hypothetical protein
VGLCVILSGKNVKFSDIKTGIESFIYPTDAQLDCSKNVKIYMRGAATCFGFFHNHHQGATVCALLKL